MTKKLKKHIKDINSQIMYSGHKSGFGVLYIVIIIGSISLGLSLWLSSSSYFSVNSAFNNRDSAQARSLINGCAEITLDRIRQNQSYSGLDVINLLDNSCQIEVIHVDTTSRIIKAYVEVGSSVRKLEILTDGFNPINIDSWIEIP